MARLVQFAQHGDADRLKVVERPIRHPEAGEVLIEVKAFGIQRADILWREGIDSDENNLPNVGRALAVSLSFNTNYCATQNLIACEVRNLCPLLPHTRR